MTDLIRNLKIGPRLVAGFLLVILLTLSLGAVELFKVIELSQTTQDMYNHPLTVGYNIREIESHTFAIHRDVKDLILAANEQELSATIRDIDELEIEVLRHFDVVSERFLGNQEKIIDARKTFQQWRFFREEIIAFKRQGSTPDALAIVKGKGLDHVNGLIRKLGSVKEFATKKAEEFRAKAEQNKNASIKQTLAVLLLVLLLVMGLSWVLTRSITKPLGRLVDWIQQIEKGDLTTKQVSANDELGKLGSAINSMVTLQKATQEEAERQNWYKDGLASLNDSLVGHSQMDRLADTAVEQLAEHVKAGVGALYLIEGDLLELAGSYAFVRREELSDQFTIGTGLVGQVAKGEKPILLTQVSREQSIIQSGTSASAPQEIYCCPLLHEGALLGVLELGSPRAFTQVELEFLNEACIVTANYLNTQVQQARIQHLLDDAQQTNEKLQMQSEELNQTNSELSVQQQQLEESNQQMEEQQQMLMESKEQLSRQYDELNQAQTVLAQKSQELSATNTYKSEFMANMSHELRSPLNSIILLGQKLAKDKDHAFEPAQVKQFRIIEESGRELLRLINDILDLSKVEAGKMELLGEAVDSGHLLESMQDLFSPQAEEKGLVFELDDQYKGQFINDRARLAQILRNLLSNAFKFTKQGQITLRAKKDSGNLPLVIEVEDTGIGIADDKKSLIFEAFHQADGSTSREYGGTGLGLSISLELAHLMGGQIELESLEGKGSLFRLRLPERINAHFSPTKRPESWTFTPELEKAADSMSQGTLLLVEDDMVFAEYLSERLTERGITNIHTPMGEEAVKIANQTPLIGVILDLGLPDISGIDVLAELRSKEKTQSLPVFIVTAAEPTETSKKLDTIGYLTKPLQDEDFEKMVQAFITPTVEVNKQALLVEDNEIEAEVLMGLTSELDLVAQRAKTLEEAVTALREQWFDLVILDLRLGQQDGSSLFETLRHMDPKPPVIVYTGKELTAEEADDLSRDARSIVIKTAFSRERLLDELNWALSAPEEERVRPVAYSGGNLKGKRILIVDDDIKNIFVIASVLAEAEAETVHAKNGQEALDLLRKDSNVDLVLMDIMMPVMDGYQAMSEIRKDKALAHLPVVAVTAKAMKDDRKKCLDAGADDYLSKPLDGDILIGMIKAWVNKPKGC